MSLSIEFASSHRIPSFPTTSDLTRHEHSLHHRLSIQHLDSAPLEVKAFLSRFKTGQKHRPRYEHPEEERHDSIIELLD